MCFTNPVPLLFKECVIGVAAVGALPSRSSRWRLGNPRLTRGELLGFAGGDLCGAFGIAGLLLLLGFAARLVPASVATRGGS